MDDKEYIDWYKKYKDENPEEFNTSYSPSSIASAAFEAGKRLGLKRSPEYARKIVADLLCLLLDLDAKDKLLSDQIKKIEEAENFLNK